MNYIDILNNKKVIESYNKIDEINPYSFNHGLKHIKNVCKIMNKICSILDINGDEKEALLIASALHDIGQVDGREEHGKKARDFLINNFESELKTQPYYSYILDAIEKHDDWCIVDNSLFMILVQFCDKLDFSKDRLEDNYKDRFKFCCYENINRIDFIYNIDNFGINIITSNVENFAEMFLKENFSKIVINAVEVLAKKLDRKVIILNNKKPISIEIE